MRIRRTALIFALVCAAGPALACTQDELQAKALSLGDLVNKIMTKDPATANDWKQKEIAVSGAVQSAQDIDTACSIYDKAIAEAQASQ